MLNRLLKTKLGYSSGNSVVSYNFLVKSINDSIPGEKFQLVNEELELIQSMNKLAKSLNGRNLLKMNLKYTSEISEIESNLNWAVKVLNSSTRK